jgi:SAM-dependent methyltransferase
MALTCPIDLDAAQLREDVRAMYSRVEAEPGGDFHFHRGVDYAVDMLRYQRDELDALPERSTASFAGVGNPHIIAKISTGECVLDIGSGSATDLLLAARRVGPSGRAIGVDMTDAMIDRARDSASALGMKHVEVRRGDAEELPVDDACIDVVISNGVLNLTTDKRRAFAEIVRVLKPGGRLQLADIVVESELSEGIRRDIDLWAS